MSSPLVSIVIPTFNQPALLRETLDSVFAQTLTDFEVIVVDDGSTDDTARQLEELAAGEPRLRVVTRVNAGTGAARNHGVSLARGTFVALLDHDDLWRPEKLAVQVAFMEAMPSCVACVTPLAFSDDPQTPLLVRGRDSQPDGVVDRPFLRAARKTALFLTCSALLFRREAAVRVGALFGEERGVIEDMQFYLRLLSAGALGLAGEGILAIYRTHGANSSFKPRYWDGGRQLLRQMQRDNAFAALSPEAEQDAAAWIAFVGRATAINLLLNGWRWGGWRTYAAEFAHQVRDRQFKFLAGYPVFAAGPRGLVRRWANRK